MPSYAHVVTKDACPVCRAPLSPPCDLVAFQWGYCPSRQPWDDLFYADGDEIRWRLDDENRAPAWCYFEGTLQGGNVGDPAVSDLIVRALDPSGEALTCAACGAELAVRIERGRIAELVRAVEGADIAVIGADGGVTPRPDWDDHAMPDLLRVRNRVLVSSSGRAVGKLAPE